MRTTAAAWIFGLGLLFLFGFATHVLTRSPCLGVADILDFWRVARPAGIEHVAPLAHPGYYVRCRFQTGEADLASAPSSSAVLAWVARHVGWGLSPADGGMDLRQMGLLCLALVALIFVVGLRSGLSPVLAFFFLYVLVDPGYLLFFNSFYADAALCIALVGVTIWLERQGGARASWWRQSGVVWGGGLAMLALLTLLGAASKMQYVPLPLVLLAAMGLPVIINARRAPVRALVLAVALLVIASASFWNFFYGPGPRFLAYNNYHAVYGGILRVAADREKVLERLGVPRDFWNLPRKDAWSAKVGLDHPVHPHLQDLSRARLFGLYLFDAGARRGALTEITDKLLLVDAHPRGTRVRGTDAGRPIRRTYQTFWQFSKLSRPVLNLWRPLVWVLVAACAGWVLAGLWTRRWRGARTAMLFLLLWAGSQMIVAVLGEGLINLHQHLLGARLALDLLFVLLAVEVVRTAVRRRFPPADPPRSRG